MNQNALQSILASEVQAILAKGVPISIDVININDIYFASVKIFETHARIEGQEIGLLMIDNQFVTTDNPSDMVHIIKGIVGNFDNLSIHDASTDEERSAIEEVLKL